MFAQLDYLNFTGDLDFISLAHNHPHMKSDKLYFTNLHVHKKTMVMSVNALVEPPFENPGSIPNTVDIETSM